MSCRYNKGNIQLKGSKFKENYYYYYYYIFVKEIILTLMCSLWKLSARKYSLWVLTVHLELSSSETKNCLFGLTVNIWLFEQTFEVGYLLKTLKMASSAATVFPDPVGAPSRTLQSVWYRVWNICVWTGLKWLKLYRASYALHPKAVIGKGWRSNNSEKHEWYYYKITNNTMYSTGHYISNNENNP